MFNVSNYKIFNYMKKILFISMEKIKYIYLFIKKKKKKFINFIVKYEIFFFFHKIYV